MGKAKKHSPEQIVNILRQIDWHKARNSHCEFYVQLSSSSYGAATSLESVESQARRPATCRRAVSFILR